MPDDDPIYYPDFKCHMAPLRPSAAPKEGCRCAVCRWLTYDAALGTLRGPVRPGTPEWDALLAAAR